MDYMSIFMAHRAAKAAVSLFAFTLSTGYAPAQDTVEPPRGSASFAGARGNITGKNPSRFNPMLFFFLVALPDREWPHGGDEEAGNEGDRDSAEQQQPIAAC